MGQVNLTAFLEDAFGAFSPTSSAVGRVVIDPDYSATPDISDLSGIADELIRCLRQKTPDSASLGSPQGYDIQMADDYPILRKYVKSITLFEQGHQIGSWVQILPPGNR